MANIASIAEDMERQTKRKTEEISQLNAYMYFRGISSKDQRRYRRIYLQQVDAKKVNADDQSVMDVLSSSLRNEVIRYVLATFAFTGHYEIEINFTVCFLYSRWVMRDLLEACEKHDDFLIHLQLACFRG